MRLLTEGIDDPSREIPFSEKWSPNVQLGLWLYFCTCFIALSLLPNSIWDPEDVSYTHLTLQTTYYV